MSRIGWVAVAATIALVGVGVRVAGAVDHENEQGFKVIFDGKSLDGWKIAENPSSFKLQDGALVAHGPRAHAFYVGDEKPFRNFELKADVMTRKNANGGIFFHTKYQDRDWPNQGFEAQVNNTFQPDPRKTGSLYNVKDVLNTSPVGDDVWFTEHVIVQGPKVTIKVEGKTVVEWTDPEGTAPGQGLKNRVGEGTFALQAHDPESVVFYKNIRVKRLPN
ncbi:MAG: DUF1080 domain-containing protein [Armatimonadota bacterium]